MKNKEIIDRLKRAVDQEVTEWNKTRLSPLEQFNVETYVIGGITKAALVLLPTDLYFEFTNWIHETYGIGHSVTSWKEEA